MAERRDFVVVGGGAAGLTAANAIAGAERNVALIDPGPVGGLCSLRGCNPKKIMVRATELLQDCKIAFRHGVVPDGLRLDWDKTLERMHSFTDPVPASTEKSLRRFGIDFIKGKARFVSPERITADGRAIDFEGLLIASGSRPRRLGLPGAEYLATSDDVLNTHAPPDSMVIIGAGAIAFEYGQMYSRLGTRVHVLVRSSMLKRMDSEAVEHLVAYSESIGIDFHRSVEATSIGRGKQRFVVNLDSGEALEVDYVLNATGRVLAAEHMNLEAAGVNYSATGVDVDDYLRSPTNPRVFAAGDAHGVFQLTPVAGYEARVVAHNFISPIPKPVDYTAVPMAVYTVPPLAAVGMTEQQVREQGIEYETVRADMSDWTVFAIADQGPAYAKVLYEKHTGEILGAHLYGPDADNTIHIFAMARRYGITRHQLKEMIYVYPSMGSIALSLL